MLGTNISYPRNRWFLQGLWTLALVFQFYLPFVIAPVLPDIINEYSLNYATAGALITVVAMIGGLSMFAGDAVIRVLGLKKGTTLMLVFFLLGSILSAISASYMVLMTGRILIGVGFGLLRALTGAKTITWFRRKEQPFINTFESVIETIAQSAAFAFTIPIVVLVGNWHNIFSYCSISIAVVLIVWMLFGKETPVVGSVSNVKPDTSYKKNDSLIVTWIKKEVRILTYAHVGTAMAFSAIATFGPTFLQEARGISAASAATITSVMPIAGLVGCLVVGSLSGITGLRRPFTWPIMVLALLGIIVFSFSTNPFLIVIGLSAVGFGLSGFIPQILTILMDLPDMTPRMVASGIALTMGVPQILTLSVSWIFNGLVSLSNLSGAFMSFGVLLVISLIFTLMLPETGTSRNKKKLEETVEVGPLVK